MSGDHLTRIWNDLVGRLGGPMSFRFLMQPAMGAIFAIRDGLKDARAGNPPFLWLIRTDHAQRKARLHEGWKAVGKIFALAVILDVIYQVTVLHTFYPGETLIVAFVVAILPYFLLRGLVTRLATWASRRKRGPDSARRAA